MNAEARVFLKRKGVEKCGENDEETKKDMKILMFFVSTDESDLALALDPQDLDDLDGHQPCLGGTLEKNPSQALKADQTR